VALPDGRVVGAGFRDGVSHHPGGLHRAPRGAQLHALRVQRPLHRVHMVVPEPRYHPHSAAVDLLDRDPEGPRGSHVGDDARLNQEVARLIRRQQLAPGTGHANRSQQQITAHRRWARRASCARRISAASTGLAYSPSPSSSAITVSTMLSGLFWLSLRLADTRVGVRRNPTVPASSAATNSSVLGACHIIRGCGSFCSKWVTRSSSTFRLARVSTISGTPA